MVARQRLGKRSYRGNEYTRNNRIVGRVVFYVVRVISQGNRRLVLPRTFCIIYYMNIFIGDKTRKIGIQATAESMHG
jgi:hypothetical protein